MSQKVTGKVFAFLESKYLRMGFIIVGGIAIILGAYQLSIHGSLMLQLAVAFLLALLIFRFPFGGLLLFVGMIPLESAFLSIAGGAATYTLLLGVYLFALWVLRIVRERPMIAVMPYTKWLLPFLLWAAASMLWAADSHSSLQYLLTLIQMFVLGLLVYNQVNDRRRLNLILMLLLASSTLAVFLGYFQSGTLTGSALLTIQSQGIKEYASIVGLAFLSGVILYFYKDKNHRSLLPLLVSALSLYPLFASAERGVFLALLVALLALVLISQRKLTYIAYGLLAILAVYAAFHLAAQFGWLSSFAISRFSLQNIIETGGTGRTDIWNVGWKIVQANPMIGVGLGNFSAVFPKYAGYAAIGTDFTGSGPHSDLLSVTAETGIIGLVLFIGLLGSLGIRLLSSFRRPLDPTLHVLSAWVLGLYVYCLSIGLTSVFMYRKLFWLAIVLVEVVIRLNMDASGAAAPVLPKREPAARFEKKKELPG